MDIDTTCAPELLIYRLSVWPALADFDAVRHQLISDRHLMAHTSVLVDLRTTAMPKGELGERTREVILSSDCGRCAVVVRDTEQELFIANLTEGGLQLFPAGVFREEVEALTWLFPNTRHFPLSFLR